MNTKIFIDQIPVKSEKTSLKEQVEEKYGRNARVIDIIEKTKQHEYCGPYHDWWTVYTVRIEVDGSEDLCKAKEIIRTVLNDVNDKNGCRLTMSIYNEAREFLGEVEKMTKEKLKQKAEEFAITYGIGDNFNVSEFIDFAVKFATEELETLEHNKKTVYHLSNCLSDAQEKKITELEKENAELKKRVDNLYNSDCSIQFHEKKLTCTQTVIRYEKKIQGT